MNKLVTAAVVGGAALACGVLPAVSAAAAVAPTPIPVPSSPAAPTTTPHAPGHRAPGHHRAPSHRTPGHHRAPSHHRGPTTPSGHGTPGGHGGPGTGGGSHRAPSHHRTPRPTPGGGTHKPRHPVSHRPVTGTPTETPRPTPRIIGGKPVTEAPWAVQVMWDSSGFECSGTSIAPQWVLTARHCVNPDGMTVLIGSTELGQGTKAVVDDKIVDPVGDMALLHLTEPVDTEYVRLADEEPQVGAINTIYGWGKTAEASGPSEVLRAAKVKVTALDCQDAQEGRAICSTGINGAAYNGDSGGPEMAGGAEVGVCSTGDDQSKKQQYASVAANRAWIRQVANV